MTDQANTAPDAAPLDLQTLSDAGAADVGVEPAAARRAVIAALGLLDRHAAVDAMEPLYLAVGGAREAAHSEAARPVRAGGLFGGLMKAAGGVSGKAVADAMALLDQAEAQGLDKAALKALLGALRRRIGATTGRDILGDAIRSVPGVGPLLA